MGEVERVGVAPEDITTERNILVEEIGLGEAQFDRFRIGRVIDRGAQLLPLAAEVALADRGVDDEAFEARKACRQLQFARRFFLDVRLEHDAVGRRPLLLRDFQLLLEKAQALDAFLRTLDCDAVEGVAFGHAEFAADNLVLRQRIPVDVDAFDIHARGIGDAERNVHRLGFFVTLELRIDLGKGIAEKARCLRHALDGIFDLFGIIPLPFLHRQQRLDHFGFEVTNVAFDVYVTEFVTIAFLDHISDDEVTLVGGQFGDSRDHAEIGIAVGEVKLPQFALVIRKAVGVIAIVRREKAIESRPLGNHFTAQPTIVEHFVADDIDLADLRLRPFADFIDDIDAVLVEHDHLRLDRRSKAPLAAIQLDNPGNVGAHFRPRENRARRELQFLAELVFLDALVSFEDDPVDDRIFLDDDRQRTLLVTNLNVGEQLGRKQILQGLVQRFAGISPTGAQLDIRTNGFALDPLRPRDGNRLDRPAIGLRCRGRRWGCQQRRWWRRCLCKCQCWNTAKHCANQQDRQRSARVQHRLFNCHAETALRNIYNLRAALPDARHPINPAMPCQRPKPAKSFTVTTNMNNNSANNPDR